MASATEALTDRATKMLIYMKGLSWKKNKGEPGSWPKTETQQEGRLRVGVKGFIESGHRCIMVGPSGGDSMT